jgi:hypothetical protein
MMPMLADDAPISQSTSCDHDNVHAVLIAGDAVAGPYEEVTAWRGTTRLLIDYGVLPTRCPDAQFYLGFMNSTAGRPAE